MARLRGNAEGTLDAKGRATVPAKFRPMFEGEGKDGRDEKEELVLWEPQGLAQPFLMLTTGQYFDEVIEREYAQADKHDRQEMLHDILGHMDEIELDSAARFVIPDKYCAKAGFRRGEKLFFLANRTYMEIWSLDVWRQREAARQQLRSLVDYTPEPTRRQEAGDRRQEDGREAGERRQEEGQEAQA
jgi:DNA-binding transcriptional regulator/RsmH inhibitor MraZ